MIKDKQVVSAHDISEGGLAINLLESGFNRGLGFAVAADTDLRKDAFWFGEAQSRVVVSCTQAQLSKVEEMAKAAGIATTVLGKVTSSAVEVNGESWGTIDSWKNLYDTAIENLINQ